MFHKEIMTDIGRYRQSAQEMDDYRANNVAYQYLCHLEEAKLWMERVLKRKLPPVNELEENLRNGVVLARLGHFIAPDVVPLGSIYDPDQKRCEKMGLNFRHTDNINLWLRALERAGFPRIFMPEVPDVFDKKNMPKVVYCLHALSAHLFRLGLAPAVQDLYGKVQFTDDDIINVCKELKESGVVMPAFQKIGGLFGNNEGNPLEAAMLAIHAVLSDGTVDDLFTTLSDPVLQLELVKQRNVQEYFRVLSSAKNGKLEASLNKSVNGSYESEDGDEMLSLPEIQGYIHSVNLDVFWTALVNSKNGEEKQQILTENSSELGDDYLPENNKFYVEVLESLPLTQIPLDDVRRLMFQIIRTGNNRSTEEKNELQLMKRFREILDHETADDLLVQLKQCNWLNTRDFAAPLYLYELQQHINMTGKLDRAIIASCVVVMNLVAAISSATDTGNAEILYEALCDLNNHLNQVLEIIPSQRQNYLQQLESARSEKFGQDLELLTIEDIQDAVSAANEFASNQDQKLDCLEKITEALQQNDLRSLQYFLSQLAPETDPSKIGYYEAVLRAKRKQLWLEDVLNVAEEAAALEVAVEERKEFLYNVRKAVELKNGLTLMKLINHQCDSDVLPVLEKLFNQKSGHLARENVNGVQVYIDTHTGEHSFRHLSHWTNSDFGISSQDVEIALSKLQINQQKSLARQSAAAVKIQAAWRGYRVREMVRNWIDAARLIQRWWRNKRMLLHKADGERFMDYYLNHMQQINAIQGCLINRQKRKAETEISPQPSCKNGNPNSENVPSADAVEELIQKLRREVIEIIKKNQELSKKLEDMDTKIGLLVRNRISIAAIMAENKNQKQTCPKSSGIKSLCKEAKTLLDGYQKLFYLLQTRPEYLARIMTDSSNLTIQSSIMNLFNMGSSARDAYLLLRLFSTALREEVQEKFRKPSDTASSYPFVLKMAVEYARQTGGQHGLQYLLAPLIYKVLEENITLDTNPIDIYRRWLNETEVNSGCASQLPRNVSQDEALSHPEVVDRLQRNINRLKLWVKEFLSRLSENTHRFPYALKFIAKSLSEALLEKFPEASEKEILKVIGHLIYYRYVNSALVAPDAFHIISLPAQQPLRADQRKNLASIAKILQFSASKNGFGEESRHLIQLNPFIIECHEAMKEICRECCRVENLEQHYHVSQFSEALLMRRPRVYMTVAELCECHQMLVKLRYTVAPDPTDPIHEVLEDLKEVPTPAALLGCSPEVAANIFVEKSLICLELDHEFFAEPCDAKPANDKIELSIRREAQNKELRDLKMTLARLQEKTKHFEEQIGYYDKYLQRCLSNFTLKKKKKSKSGRVVKYTAEQLKKKGVLTNLDSVPLEQQHNVEFEIAPGDINGRFCVKCRFMGVEVDRADIDIQHLLSLQFEGCGVMNMFGKAEINVNLLIFLLNKKFTGLKDIKKPEW